MAEKILFSVKRAITVDVTKLLRGAMVRGDRIMAVVAMSPARQKSRSLLDRSMPFL
jgi:hypothetical protein